MFFDCIGIKLKINKNTISRKIFKYFAIKQHVPSSPWVQEKSQGQLGNILNKIILK